jgi:hypothetical protein
MLHEFLTSHRERLIDLCREKVAKRFEPTAVAGGIDHGVPLFLEQLAETLRDEQSTQFRDFNSEPAPTPATTAIGRAAALHGAELLRRGFSVDQVVHDYGDVCQSVMGLAVELDVPISTDEFRTLNRCLDNAIADAVASFGAGRLTTTEHRQLATWQQRLDDFAAEQRRLVDIATHSLAAIRTGNVGTNGATSALLAHALEELRSLNDRTLPDILRAGPNANGASDVVAHPP